MQGRGPDVRKLIPKQERKRMPSNDLDTLR